MNGCTVIGMSVMTDCGWFIVRDRKHKHNVDSLNWILERMGNQCKMKLLLRRYVLTSSTS